MRQQLIDEPGTENREAFLPDLCTLQAVFLLVLLGELLALALTLAASVPMHLNWSLLGTHSFLTQWVVLLSAALLCPIRFWLNTLPSWLAGLLSFLVVLLATLGCSLLGLWAMALWEQPDFNVLANNLFIAAIFGGVVLRYLYVQQQWHNQQQAELNARVQALQSRIQPHFLFNSMNTIASLIAIDPVKAERTVEDLSSLFRASLAEPGLVKLADEVALCRQYLAIEQMRLGERLHLHWQIPEQTLLQRCLIPSLMLQPLVENAIVHGISPNPAGGEVTIAITESAGGVRIRVSNPVWEGARVGGGNGIALDNIRHRLALYFGPQAHCLVDHQTQVFVVEISYPIDRSWEAGV